MSDQTEQDELTQYEAWVSMAKASKSLWGADGARSNITDQTGNFHAPALLARALVEVSELREKLQKKA